MGWSKQDRIIKHDKIVAMLPEVRKYIMKKYPFVVSVDVGIREVKGKLKQEIAFRVHVPKKKALSRLKKSEILPNEIKGVPIDVQTARKFVLQEDTKTYSPLWGGTQGIGKGGTGTIGCFVHVHGDTKVHVLSNHHVFMGPNGAAGDLIGHPGSACDSCCCTCNQLATLVDGKVGVETPPGGDPNIVDAAYALLLGQEPTDTIKISYSNRIIGIGPIFGSAPPVFGSVVRKRGRTTGFTEGTITSITADVIDIEYDGPSMTTYEATYTGNQIDIAPTAAYDRWSAGGDSGSAVVNSLNQVIGLHFAGDGTNGTANIIENVLHATGWNLRVLSSGTVGAIPISGIQADTIPAARPSTFIQKMEKKLKQTPNGQGLLEIINQHHYEVLDLINDNREVKVAWHRYQGPHFIGHLAKNAQEPGHNLPKELNGYSFQNLLLKMSDVLERNGSYQLAQSIEEYSLSVFNFAEEYNGIHSIDNLIDKYEFCPNCGQMNKTMPYA